VEPGAVNTVHLILDGAKRDRAVWSADQLISDLTDYYVSDPAYARDSNALFLEHPASTAGRVVPAVGVMAQPGPLPGACSPDPNAEGDGCVTWSASYSMAPIVSLYNYYLYSGDLDFVRAHWQAVLRQMEWDAEQIDSNGLFAVNTMDGADWNVEVTSGEQTYVNAVYVEALQASAKLAVALGQMQQANAWSAQAAAVSTAVNGQLWDAQTGVYDPSTSERGSVLQDANVTAILAGIPTGARAREIATVLQSSLRSPYGSMSVSSPVPSGYKQTISPYIGGFNVLADFAIGDESAALALIRQEWGYMISHDPGGTEWENIPLDGTIAGYPVAGSSAHAWSTGPTPALSEYVLGVTPATPGFATWAVAPQPGGLTWAQGAVPTPHGSIAVRWRSGRGTFVLTVVAPRGTSGSVAVPRSIRTAGG